LENNLVRSPSRAKQWSIARPTPADAPVMTTVRAEMLHATHHRPNAVGFVRSNRLEIDGCRVSRRRALVGSGLRNDRQLQHSCSLSRARAVWSDRSEARWRRGASPRASLGATVLPTGTTVSGAAMSFMGPNATRRTANWSQSSGVAEWRPRMLPPTCWSSAERCFSFFV